MCKPGVGNGYSQDLQGEAAQAVRLLGSQIIQSGDKRLLLNLEKIIPILVSTFRYNEGETIGVFGELAAKATASGQDKLATSFMAYLPAIKAFLKDVSLGHAAEDALVIIQQASAGSIGKREITLEPVSLSH